MTLQPARFSNAIPSATLGRKWKSSQRVTYSPPPALRLITPSRSRNAALFIKQLLLHDPAAARWQAPAIARVPLASFRRVAGPLNRPVDSSRKITQAFHFLLREDSPITVRFPLSRLPR